MTALVVTAAVVERGGRFLITRRQEGVHLEGHWEFPGGKCDPGEPLAACMARELREELDLDATVGEELLSTAYEYADRLVEIHFLRCAVTGDPLPQLGQEVRWASPEEFETLTFPPADAELIRRLSAR